MTTLLVSAGVVFLVLVSSAVVSGYFQNMMIGEINRRRSEGDQMSYVGFTLPKGLRIFREYRNLYPHGKLHLYLAGCIGLVFVSWAVLAVMMIIFISMRDGSPR